MTDFHENDLVALLVDQPNDGLRRGDIGTIVHVFDANNDHPTGFVVEFVDKSGRVKVQTDIIDSSLIVKLRFQFLPEDTH